MLYGSLSADLCGDSIIDLKLFWLVKYSFKSPLKAKHLQLRPYRHVIGRWKSWSCFLKKKPREGRFQWKTMMPLSDHWTARFKFFRAEILEHKRKDAKTWKHSISKPFFSQLAELKFFKYLGFYVVQQVPLCIDQHRHIQKYLALPLFLDCLLEFTVSCLD